MRDPLEQLRAIAAALPTDGAATLSSAFLAAVVAALPSGAPAPDLALPEAAQALNISPDTARRLAKSGVLRAYRAGSQWRVTREALEHYRRGEHAAPAPNHQPRGRRAAPDLGAWRRGRTI